MVSVVTGIARSTIGRGLAELGHGKDQIPGRSRRPGGGRKPKTETEPGLLEALSELVQSAIRGDPEAALLWVSRSQRYLARALAERGFTASQKLVGRLLRQLGFSLQANSKTREGTQHPDRNAQFEHINAQVQAFQAAGQPAISVAPRRRSWSATSRMAGVSCVRRGSPSRCGCTISLCQNSAKWPHTGSTTSHTGWINLGITSDTAAFAVESIRRWWHELGHARYPDAERLLITADCGGSNGARVRLWKAELQTLADQTEGARRPGSEEPAGADRSQSGHGRAREGPGQQEDYVPAG